MLLHDHRGLIVQRRIAKVLPGSLARGLGGRNHHNAARLWGKLIPEDLLVHPISLEPDEQAMDWQGEGDGWLLLSSQPLPQGGWRSRIQRFTLLAKKLHGKEVVVSLMRLCQRGHWSVLQIDGLWVLAFHHFRENSKKEVALLSNHLGIAFGTQSR